MGRLESNPSTDMPLSDLLQVSASNKRSLRIQIVGRHGAGELHLKDGRVAHAEYGDLTGEAAALALLAEADRPYRIVGDRISEKSSVERGINTLLITSAQLSDEGRLPRPSTSKGSAKRTRRALVGLSLGVVAVVAATIALVRAPESGGPKADEPGPVSSTGSVDIAELKDEGDRAPVLVAGEPPQSPSPDGALNPTVVCRVLVDSEGEVSEAEIYAPRPELRIFEQAALAAVRTYRFEPAIRDGQAIASWINWPVRFASRAGAAVLSIKGSDTIGSQLGPALAQAIEAGDAPIKVELQALGSSSGFAGLFDGSAEIAMASRPVSPSELAEAARLGIRLREFIIGYDGLAIVVHPKNPLESISITDAARLFNGEIRSWDELGVDLGTVHVLSRPSYSGTHGFFVDHVLSQGRSRGFTSQAEYIEKNETIVARLRRDPSAVSYVGLGWTEGVKALAVSSLGGEAIPANLATVRDSSYPLNRALILYTRGAPRGAAATFLRFALSREGQALVREHGFVSSDAPVDPDAFREGREAQAPPTVTRVKFGLGRHGLSVKARRTLDEVADELKRPGRIALVVGNSDSMSEGKRNREVSLRRARAVVRYLRDAGVPPVRLRVEAVSGDRPLASNTDPAGREANRRVDIFMLESGRRIR